LTHEDRHLRANAAFVFGRFGDSRGLQVLEEILSDRSDRPEGQGRPGGNYNLASQIRADRYYAVHVLGELRDAAAVPILVPLLQDDEVDYKVPWALGLIGDRSAIPPLIAALDDENPSLRVHVIYALETLNAREALPRLAALLTDHRRSNFGAAVSVAEAAQGAIATLK
jgi:HEAT repeat protein